MPPRSWPAPVSTARSSRPRSPHYGPARANCSAGRRCARSADQFVADPTLLTRRAQIWLPLSSKGDVAAKRDGDPAIEKLVDAARRQGRDPHALQPRLPDRVRRDRQFGRRRVGRAQGQLPDDHRDDAARLPDRRSVGALSRGIRAAQPLDRHDRSVDQQSRRGAVDHLRAARARGVSQLHALAALGAAGRRADAGADDHAGDRHRRAQRDQVGAAVDPRCRARRRRVEDAGRVPPRPAAGACPAS